MEGNKVVNFGTEKVTNEFLKLGDTNWINAMRNAILGNPDLFKNKLVLNLNCGLGLFAIYAVQAGASHVYAVDSGGVQVYTRRIIKENKCDERVTVIEGDVEQMELPVEMVDVILCDWVGNALLYGANAKQVIYARNKWLQSNGLIFPDIARIFVRLASDFKTVENGGSVIGSDLGCSMNSMFQDSIDTVWYYAMPKEKIRSTGALIKAIDLNTAEVQDLAFHTSLIMETYSNCNINSIVLSYMVMCSKAAFYYNTDPVNIYGQFLQSVSFFKRSNSVAAGLSVHAEIAMTDVENSDYNTRLPKLRCQLLDINSHGIQALNGGSWCVGPYARKEKSKYFDNNFYIDLLWPQFVRFDAVRIAQELKLKNDRALDSMRNVTGSSNGQISSSVEDLEVMTD
ncbi:protein arginine N-methyltransferase 1-B-like [Teleopsis dalmanni]|uniref:protein arginine N-methyltransferase 1-B-like n=1 Tax=Teleopsis dalmanni TaxID=139649 RepID=UPI0018CCF5DB|nr:protein arginine N-methyltransferase 1-B-like [Teleopsis dalmanni]XP_037955435.1 protein arginine N-methyltransferase 1-B-like [Teleopsis dalmanni]